MALDAYRAKRDFHRSPEPRGAARAARKGGHSFVVQKHAARQLHYDFRLEQDGVLLSWAVPKGPSLDPADKRLAMEVEDHPLEYGAFEGVIPAGEYGGGTVMVWDRGIWIPQGDPVEGYARGHLKFTLEGEKLKGGWALVRTHGSKAGGKPGHAAWLLIKEKDAYARPGNGSVVDRAPDSVMSGRSVDEISRARERVWRSRLSARANVEAGAVESRPAPAQGNGTRRWRTGSGGQERTDAGADRADAGHAGRACARRQTAGSPKSSMTATGWCAASIVAAPGSIRATARSGRMYFPSVARDLASLPVRRAWIDGEVVIVDARGPNELPGIAECAHRSIRARPRVLCLRPRVSGRL